MKILVAEDEPLMLMAIEVKLKNEKFEVATAMDGSQAIKVFEAFKPDLVITDILMPYTSGLEVVSIIKSKNKNIPIIVLSGIGEEETVMESFQLGADDFITKPFNPAEMMVRIRRLLKLR